MSAKRGLGKGLGAFFGDEVVQEVVTDKETQKEVKREADKLSLKISEIEPNKSQPRKGFDDEKLQELADSIRQYGIIQPLVVKKKDSYYQLIAGERRWRAAMIAGLKEVPVVIKDYNDHQVMEIALIENVQREDLNPIEEAMAYQQLIQEYGLKQEEVASRVSKSRTVITNSMRLLKLDPKVQQMLVENRISNGHARALLVIENPKVQIQMAEKIEKYNMSVREIEKAVKLLDKKPKTKKEKPEEEALTLVFQELEDRMKMIMGTKVLISRKDRNKGRIEIEYYSESELERIVELIESIR